MISSRLLFPHLVITTAPSLSFPLDLDADKQSVTTRSVVFVPTVIPSVWGAICVDVKLETDKRIVRQEDN